jgi:hypothetical protein
VTLGVLGLWAIGIVLIFVGYFMLQYTRLFRRFLLWGLHLLYGERIPKLIWTPRVGGVGFVLCGIAAITIGIVTTIQNQ